MMLTYVATASAQVQREEGEPGELFLVPGVLLGFGLFLLVRRPYLILRVLSYGGLLVHGVFVLVRSVLTRRRSSSPTEVGLATREQLRASLGLEAARRRAALTRSSVDVRSVRSHQYAVLLGTAAPAEHLFGTHEDTYLVLAPPRSGKTALLGGWVIDAPGGVVATSTKPDLYQHTVAMRSRHGPVWVFDPDRLTGLPPSLCWSPVAGCEHPGTAIERAGYLLAGAAPTEGVRNEDFWSGNAARALRAYLHAAALGERTMQDVAAWATDPENRTAITLLRAHADRAAPGWADALEQLMDGPPVTRDSVYLTLSLTLGFMADPNVAACTMPAPGEAFDVAELITRCGTLYLIGAEKVGGTVAPLFVALAGYIDTEAKKLAAREIHGRLDPPLTLALDEAALICPVPLDRWTADAGGRGITLMAAIQSPSQMYDRWGERGGQTIWNNSTVKIVFGGLTNAHDLEGLSQVCGEVDVPQVTTTRNPWGGVGGYGSTSYSTNYQRRRVLTPDQIRTLPAWTVLVLHRTTPPTVASFLPVWDRPDVKAAAKAALAAEQAAGEAVPLTDPDASGA